VILGKAQLDAKKVKDSIESFLKADDATYFEQVIYEAKRENLFQELIGFIRMAQKAVKNPLIDNELIYAFAKTNQLADLEEFINAKNYAKYPEVGQTLYDQGLYVAAKIIYRHIKDNSKLALCFVHLKEFKSAFEAARDANKTEIWKEVCLACVDAVEFRLASMCALNIIIYTDQLNEICTHYETLGHFDELIAVLEQGTSLDRAHQGIYTQLGILYCKYKEEKLMDHIKLFWTRLNIPRLLASCKENLHWLEAVHLYTHYSQFDNAVDTLIQHSAECWNNDLFKATVGKVSNTEIYYRAITFYMEEQPMLVNDLVTDLIPKLDHRRVVRVAQRAGHLALIKDYLCAVQSENISEINEALNGLFLEMRDHRSLRESVEDYDAFDQIPLAQKLRDHDELEFRRIAAHLYKTNKFLKESMAISKKDELWADAMQTAEESGSQELAEELMRFFVEKKEFECFSACLFTCYELVRPDVVIELAWQNKIVDLVMPFIVQTFRDYSVKMATISEKVAALTEKVEGNEAKQGEDAQKPPGNLYAMPLALPAPPMMGMNGGQPMLGQGGMGMGVGMNQQGMGMGMNPMNPGMGY